MHERDCCAARLRDELRVNPKHAIPSASHGGGIAPSISGTPIGVTRAIYFNDRRTLGAQQSTIKQPKSGTSRRNRTPNLRALSADQSLSSEGVITRRFAPSTLLEPQLRAIDIVCLPITHELILLRLHRAYHLSYTSSVTAQLEPADLRYLDLVEVHKAGLRASQLTRQLLAFSRQQVLQPVVLDFNSEFAGIERCWLRCCTGHLY